MLPYWRERTRRQSVSLSGLGSLVALYGAQGIVALTGFLYSKGVATFISPSQFGLYSVQFASMTLVYSMLVPSAIQSFKAALQRHDRADAIAFYTRLLGRFYLLVGISVGLLVLTGAWPAVVLLIWLGGALQSIVALGNDYLNVSFQHNRYAFLQALTPIVNLLLLTGLVLFWPGSRAVGLWVNYVCLYGTLAVVTTYYAYQVRREFRLSANWNKLPNRSILWREYVVYARPLIIYAFFGWVMNYADRHLIGYWLSPADVGFYSTGYSLGARVAMLATPLTVHLTPRVFDAQREGLPVEYIHSIIYRYVRLFWTMTLPVCLILWTFQNEIGKLLLSSTYESAFAIVPIIALAYSLSVSIQFLETKFYAFTQTTYILWHCMAGAVSNVLLNVALIPEYGINGAAWAMAGGCVVQLGVATYLMLNKLTDA